MSALRLYLLALAWLPPMSDANIYRYQDAGGVIHYTDSYMGSLDHQPELWARDEVDEEGVSLRVVEKADGHYFFALNQLFGPATLTLRFPQQDNVLIPHRMLQAIVLAPREERFIGKLVPALPGEWHYDYGFAYTPGERLLLASFNRPGSNRQLPAPRGLYSSQPGGLDLLSPVAGRYRISQGFNGRFSHNRPANRYALDIALPVGTPLLATRDGVVMDAVDHHSGGGLKQEYRARTNYLRLLHDDGTMSLYAHLHTGSILVKKGQRVTAGQRVAASGNTGFSSGPHLHFALQINNGNGLESIPFTLQGRYPEAGNWLLARE